MKQRKWIFIGMSIMVSLLCLSGCQKAPEKMVTAGTAMGTVVQETLYVTDAEKGSVITQDILSLIDSLEKNSLSWREEGSEIAIINAQAGETGGTVLTEQMQDDLQKIWQISEASDGALDVTVGDVTRLWDLDTWVVADAEIREQFKEPEAIRLGHAMEQTGYEKVRVEGDRIYLPEGMSLDLGAVGKGIAGDRIGAYLADCEEVTGAVISVGGSILTYGSKVDGNPWQVAIAHPREEGNYLGVLSLAGSWYVSTSGDYERYLEKDGKRYHHIMDPKTGYPVDNEVCSVTILCQDGLMSDALSTACFVLGVEDGMKLAKEMQVEALFVTKDMEIVMTEGMKKYFQVAEKSLF